MRTLKKTLALVLVVAMMMSLCITSNAAFTDAKEIEYTEAVEVLTAIGVIDGFPSGEFQPQGSLTRAQAAKILVYILGAEGAAKADGQIFDDVAPNHWAADYIAYCAEEGIVTGYGDGNFGPEDKLTAYQWAKMLLAALGEDTSAMIGAAWQIPVAKAAASYGIFAGNEKADKTEICTREEACLYALNALTYTEYYEAGYAVYENGKFYAYYDTVSEASHAAAALNASAKAAGSSDVYTIDGKAYEYSYDMLYYIHDVYTYNTRDHWGRPGYAYDSVYWASAMVYYATPVATYYTAVAECDIAVDLGLKSDKDITVSFLNGDSAKVDNNYEIDLLGTRSYVGAQGRATEIYAVRGGYEIVQVDEFLAKVLRTVDAKYDKAGHMASPAYLYLAVYDTDTNDTTVYNTVVLSSRENYTYARGDMLLVNFDCADNSKEDDYLEIVGYAASVAGKQTKLTTKASHVVDGVEYMDAVQLHLDQAGNQTGTHTWYFDSYGNLIGVVDVASVYDFGTITSIYWKDSNNGDYGYAVAEITYVNGKTETKTVYMVNDRILEGVEGNVANYNNGDVSSTKQYNTDEFTNVALYKITETPNGLVLEETTEVEGVTLKEGVTALKRGELYGDKNTVFMIWDSNAEEYTFITGVQNLPTYHETYTVWAAELEAGKDTDAEYVFVNDPTVLQTNYALYFNPYVGTVDTDLYLDTAVLYTVYGGYLNNEECEGIYILGKGEASFRLNSVWLKLNAAAGQACILTLENGYVKDVTVIDDTVDLGNRTYVAFMGELGDDVTNNAWDTVMKETATGASYDISGVAAPINAIDWEDAAGDYIWVVYNMNGLEKTALYVYAGPNPEYAALDAAIDALPTSGAGNQSADTMQAALTAAGITNVTVDSYAEKNVEGSVWEITVKLICDNHTVEYSWNYTVK